jgi:CDP-diacylglycerol--serine O-phosphatidyltransferase
MAKTRKLRRGIYLLPTLFTVGNLFCGFLSLVLCFRGAFEQAALLVIVAAVLDGLDGRIARLTGSTSEFGNEFDSLADLLSFGVAPAMLVYHWSLIDLGRIGWLVAFIFVVCAAMRLARYNIHSSVADRRYFAGLPSPSAGGALACLTFAFPQPPVAEWIAAGLAVYVGGLGLLMVSRFRYPSFKQLDLRNRRSYIYVLPVAAMLVAVAMQPKITLLLCSSLYLASAPASFVWELLRRRSRAARQAREDVADEPAYR